MASRAAASTPRVGRPRSVPPQRPGASGREQILDGAAQMFTEQGYAATSTRTIAMAVGIKQASLYYHFASKEDILAGLLTGTVHPSLEVADRLRESGATPQAQLWALTCADVSLLCSGRWNIGALYCLPELRTERFAEFRGERDALRDCYGALVREGVEAGTFTVSAPDVATTLVFSLAETVIQMRSDGCPMGDDLPEVIADSCLRLVGSGEKVLAGAAKAGRRLIDELELL